MMNTKKYKHIEAVIEDYLQLQNERLEIPLLLDKVQEKLLRIKGSKSESESYSQDDAQDLFKIFNQQQKYLEQQQEVDVEFKEVELIFKTFLAFIEGEIEFFRKEDQDKNKVTYKFWLEENHIRSNR